MNLLDASCKVAFAAMIHDIGKVVQRMENPKNRRFGQTKLEDHFQQYCRFKQDGQYWTHRHAAYTALAMDALEVHWPDMKLDGAKDDSLINAAAMHHKPETLLQQAVTLADRLASGFEREEFERHKAPEDKTDTGRNHYQARLLPFFEHITLGGSPAKQSAKDYAYRYRLRPMSANDIFPARREECEPSRDDKARDEYDALWQDFVSGLEKIPAAHRNAWPLWLDHFDSLWLTYTHAVPSATAFGVRPDVSLYDHSKATAALAVALWRFALATGVTAPETLAALQRCESEKPFLLIQGDFFGIQDFIFAEGSGTNRQAAKVLRGRSFQVSLFTELAALRLLELLELPSTSQIINAAGKFLIVAPNTEESISRLVRAKQEFDGWFIRQSFGMIGIGLAWQAAGCPDFHGQSSGFSALMKRLFDDLEKTKHQRYDLCQSRSLVLETDFPQGVCAWQGRFPADDAKDGQASCALSRDQILIGECLAAHSLVLIVREKDADAFAGRKCEISVFGCRILFADEVPCNQMAAAGALRRCWDFSLPRGLDAALWNGCARRQINGHVPRFKSDFDPALAEKKYSSDLLSGINALADNTVKTFGYIACEDRRPAPDGTGRWQGQSALAVLKGDVDNLGLIFQKGLDDPESGQRPSFAKMAALSRQMNAFFAVRLPALCRTEYPDVYTVFAGGDDFFLVGPWLSTQRLVGRMVEEFRRYVAENKGMHFSAGMIMTKPGAPVRAMAREADEALARAKKHDGKNAFCLWGSVASWDRWPDLERMEQELERIKKTYKLSTGFIYGLINLLERRLEEEQNPEAALWRSNLAYRTARLLDRVKDRQARRDAQCDIVQNIGEKGIEKMKESFRIPLFNHLYQQR